MGTYAGSNVDFDPAGGGSQLLSVTGSYDGFVVKLDSAGAFVWAKSWGGADYDELHHVHVDAGGDILATGRFQGTVDLDPGAGTSSATSNGDYDVPVFKLGSASGDFVWGMAFGGTSADRGYSVVDIQQGNHRNVVPSKVITGM